jgi:ribosome-associated toxin RatA of RatAB toxin-antitoxin module
MEDVSEQKKGIYSRGDLHRTIEVHSDAQTFYDLLTDFNSYASWLSAYDSVSILSADPDKWTVRFEMTYLSRLYFVLDFEGTPNTRLKWRMRDSNIMKEHHGSWEISPSGDEHVTATYYIWIDYGRGIMKSITDILVNRRLPKFLNDYKREAERRLLNSRR